MIIKKKKILSFVLSLTILSSFFSFNVFASDSVSVQDFAKQQIAQISSKPYNDIWTENTEIKSEFVLYDLEGFPNSYIYNLTTEGKNTGYIQIDVLDDLYTVHSYSFDGTNEVFHMLRNISQTNQNSLSYNTEQIYYLGSSFYAIKNGQKFVDLYSGNEINLNSEKLTEFYDDFVAMKKSQRATLQANSSLISVENYNNFSLVEMDDFSGKTIVGAQSSLVDDHCTPTAGTNVVKYYALCRGKSALYDGSDWNTFKALYLAMDTNGVNSSSGLIGTYWDITYSDGYAGLLDYINSKGTPASDTYRYALGGLTGINFNSIKEQIDKDHPVIMGVKSFPNAAEPDGYHSVVAFGYDSNNVMLTNGWDKSYHYYNYSSLAVHEYYYIGF